VRGGLRARRRPWACPTFDPLVALAVLTLATAACARKPLPVYGSVPDFTLTSQTGAEFHGASLDGSVWIADFFFTNCAGPCPRMSSRFRRIEKTFTNRSDLKLLSLTVDPQRDTVPAIAEYARKFGAEPGRWFFLTGPMDRLNTLCRNVFMLGNVDGNLDHSTRFVLVDRSRRIRGFYRSEDSESLQQLMRDIQLLLKEKA
jgi:protein SCO1/2